MVSASSVKREALKMTEWQKIETSPSNEVILIAERNGGEGCDYWWQIFIGSWANQLPDERYRWMPLPEPPKEKQRSDRDTNI